MINLLLKSKFKAVLLLLLALALPPALPGGENTSKSITNFTYKPGQSEISSLTNTTLEEKLSVRVTREGKPLPGEEVYFSFTHKPPKAEGAVLSTDLAVTDKAGIASSTVAVGDRPGVYQVAAFAPGVRGSPVVFSIKYLQQNV